MTYTNLFEARARHLEQIELMGSVERMWSDLGIPFPLEFSKLNNFTAVVAKPAMFRIESIAAVQMAETEELDLLWLTYDSDKFAEISKIKRSLVQPYFTDKLDKNGDFISERVKLVQELQPIRMKKLETICTPDGVSVLDLHRRRLLQAYPSIRISDMSRWASMLGNNALAYYEAYLSLFVAHGILFEDYHGGESGAGLSSFTEKVFEPAFAKVTRRFGAKPIVVKLPWKPHYAFHPRGEMLDKWREVVVPRL